MRILKDIFNVFFPSTCIICNSHLALNEHLICISCEHQLPYTNYTKNEFNPFVKKLQGRISIKAATSLLFYSKTNFSQKLIHHLKYKGRQEIGAYLGQKLGKEILASSQFKAVDGIIPVPLDEKKLKIRGYNQLCEFSKQLAKELNVPIFNNVLIKNHFSESQTHKNKNERFDTLKNLFEVKNPESLIGKHILLVDDVVTTGATLEHCANALLKIDGTKISLATMAYAEN